MLNVIGGLYLAVLLLLLATVAARSVATGHGAVITQALGSLVRLLLGLALIVGVLYFTGYFLGLVGGFYESLTCKVVTLPACEDPLALPGWLGLPEASVGGVIGILPLLGIFLAKALQPHKLTRPAAGERTDAEEPRWISPAPRPALLAGFLAWLVANASLIAIFLVELWLAWLRGAAEAADRQVRLSLGLDAQLPAAYLGVAQWGAVVLALGLSVVVLYLGVAGRYGLGVAYRGFMGVEQGAGIVALLRSVLVILASGLEVAWVSGAIVLGRFALKAQSAAVGLFAAMMIALGRLALKLQDVGYRSWVFAAVLLGRLVLFVGRVLGRVLGHVAGWFSRRPPSGVLGLALAASLGVIGYVQATTYVVLQDVSGGESARLAAANAHVLRWSDPSPQLALLQRDDRLIVIPVRAPGELDTVYSALFNAAYPGSQLDRYAFYAELRNVLPDAVDDSWGTGLSEALRSAAFYLEDVEAGEDKVLVVFGNGEDHSPDRITPDELWPGLDRAVVIMLNAGLEETGAWRALYMAAGARAVIAFDQAATRLLSVPELQRAMQRAVE